MPVCRYLAKALNEDLHLPCTALSSIITGMRATPSPTVETLVGAECPATSSLPARPPGLRRSMAQCRFIQQEGLGRAQARPPHCEGSWEHCRNVGNKRDAAEDALGQLQAKSHQGEKERDGRRGPLHPQVRPGPSGRVEVLWAARCQA